jgi:hypothetical protein
MVTWCVLSIARYALRIETAFVTRIHCFVFVGLIRRNMRESVRSRLMSYLMCRDGAARYGNCEIVYRSMCENNDEAA